MSREEIVVGLDIGTTKVCTVIGQGDSRGDINVIGVGVVPSRGIKKGVVVDVGETIAAIKDSVERAGHMAGTRVERAVAGITGDHIQSTNLHGNVSVNATDNKVTRDDVERVLQAAALEIPRDREIIHSLPREFVLDGQRGVRRPVGMVGERLEVETHVVTGSSTFLQNVVQCVERAGLQVEGLVLEPIATEEAVVTADEREMGAVLIDIGGGTSDIAVFMDGSIMYSSVISVGGNHVTRDIAIGLRTPFEIAERLKIERGAASPTLIPHGEALEVVMAGSGERLRIPRALLGEIIEARMSELFEMARNSIISSGLNRPVPGGIILSGGGALLPGAVDLAQRIFGLPVRIGRPVGLAGWSDQVSTPQFATGVGLCRFALRQRTLPGSSSDGAPFQSVQGRRVWGILVPTAVEPNSPPASAPLRPAEANQVPGAPPFAPSQISAINASAAGAPSANEAAPGGPATRTAGTSTGETWLAKAIASTAESTDDSDSPFDRIRSREQMLAGVEEPSWRRLVAKLRQWLGFDSS